MWREHPFDVLLAFLAAMIFAEPLARAGMGWIVRVLAALMPLAAVFSLGRGRRTIYVGLFLGLPAMAAIVENDLGARLIPEWVAMTFPLAIYIYVTAIIVRRVLDASRVDRTTLLAAVSGYLMLGYVWSIAYRVIGGVDAGAFGGATGADGLLDSGEATFFSFVTLTTMGYGDIVPLSPMARSLAVLEAVAGVLYLAVLVAAVVGGIRRDRQPDANVTLGK